jgi:NACHT domain
MSVCSPDTLRVIELRIVTDIDAKIREIPYGTGSRFTPDKGCLMGTRTAFLEFIVNWVNDPASERCLVLFGQAGTGKSAIAHEIARRFDTMHRLTSSFIFLRKEQSKREAYHLFTTLARDLADRYPSFKTALGRVVKDNSSLRVGTSDYDTLFRSLILEPLKGLHMVGPILVVIDALDESGDASGQTGLHTFLARNLIRLPPNFRVLITSRPEDGIEPVLDEALSVRIRHMKGSELAATTNDDILIFFQNKLHPDEFKKYGDKLATRAEGLFQWAAVASQFILAPPARFSFSKKKCINHLLKPGTSGQDPLDELYKEVLEGYFTDKEPRPLFRSVMGQIITSFEPLSIHSLTTLRRHTPALSSDNNNNDVNDDDDDDDGSAVLILLHCLGSLLSNVNSSDQNLPIIPLHTSFRDFLTNKAKSGDFCVDLRDAHHQLAHSCLGLLLSSLKFNICNLATSYLANEDVADLQSRVDKHIPPALSYACHFWDDHLKHISFETDLYGKLWTFFETKLLFWLEALSLTNHVGLALAACSALNVWLASGQGVSIIQLLIW